MTIARQLLLKNKTDYDVHLISKTVRGAFLCGQDGDGNDYGHRNAWIRNRLKKLCECFSVYMFGYALMSNHFHLVMHIAGSETRFWSDLEVAQRWLKAYPQKKLKTDQDRDRWLQEQAANQDWVALHRERLGDVSWFMRTLKYDISRQANIEDDTQGAFWQARFKSILLEDEQALLACMVYTDLNPIRAGMVQYLEASKDTSIYERIMRAQNKLADLESDYAQRYNQGRARIFPAVRSNKAQGHWLSRFGDPGSPLITKGKLTLMSLEQYIALLENSALRLRDGKAEMSIEAAGCLKRLGMCDPVTSWDSLLAKIGQTKGRGSYHISAS